MRYVVESARHGWVGALAFSAALWRLKPRDAYIGWTEAARRANLHRVVGNSRFLIRPNVHVPHLASQVLSRCLARLGEDWTERYGYAPVLAETFVDPGRFAGTCYRAANWVRLGQTAARATPYPNGKVAAGPKEIYVYPIRRQWQRVLGAEPQGPLDSTPRPEAPAAWPEEEFGRVPLFDERLKHRLFTLAADFFAQPNALVPQAANGSAARSPRRTVRMSSFFSSTSSRSRSSGPSNPSTETRGGRTPMTGASSCRSAGLIAERGRPTAAC
jgi:hypothetical protein